MKINFQKLNKRLFPLYVALFVVIAVCSAPVVSAEEYPSWSTPLKWTELDYTVRYGNDSNIVTIPLNPKRYVVSYMEHDGITYEKTIIGKETSTVIFQYRTDYRIDVFPASSFGLSLDDLPIGAIFSCDVTLWLSADTPVAVYPASLYTGCYYINDNKTHSDFYWDDLGSEYLFGSTISFSFPVKDVSTGVSVVPIVSIRDFFADTQGIYFITINNPKLTMEVSTAYWSSFENRLNGQKMDEMINGTDEQHEIVNGAVQEMDQAGSKLNGLGDQLNAVEKPNIDTFKVGLGDMIGDKTSVPMLTAPIREIWQSPVALGILTIVVTLVLVSWVFFGKKK